MPNVFVAYKSEEFEQAEKIITSLVEHGYDPFWNHKILPGEAFADEIDTIIKQVKAGVIVWSRKAQQSKWVKAEAQALNERGVAISVRIDDVAVDDLPLPFRADQILDLSEWNGSADEPAFKLLLAAIEKKIGLTKGSARNAGQATTFKNNQEAEMLYWKNLTDHPTQDGFRTYRKKFPNGIFREFAKQRLQEYAREAAEHKSEQERRERERKEDIDLKRQEAANARPGRLTPMVEAGAAAIVAVLAVAAYLGFSQAPDSIRDLFSTVESKPSAAAEDCIRLATPSMTSMDDINASTSTTLKTKIAEAYHACRTAHEEAPANVELTALYSRVLWVYGDNAAALELALQSAKQGSNLGRNVAGVILTKSTKPAEKERGLALYREAAIAGYTIAQSNIGIHLADEATNNPDHRRKLDSEAVYFLQKSSEGGNITAKSKLAMMYADRRGTDKLNKTAQELDALALELFTYSADRGDAWAQNWIGRLYDERRVAGDRTEPQRVALAMEWYAKAGNNGNIRAQRRLGQIYMCEECSPNETRPDKDKSAVFWLRKAADDNDRNAAYCLGVMLRDQRGVETKIEAVNQREAMTYFIKAADKGHTAAQLAAGRMFRDGQGVDPDTSNDNDRNAVKYFKMAAQDGDRESHLNLGWMFKEARGVDFVAWPANDDNAQFHLNIAANGKDWIAGRASYYLAELLRAERIHRDWLPDKRTIEAFRLLGLAASYGDKAATLKFAEMALDSENDALLVDFPDRARQAETYLNDLSNNGDAEAKYQLGAYLIEAPNAEENQLRSGLELLKTAAEAGNKDAMFAAARFYAAYTGIGTMSPVEADRMAVTFYIKFIEDDGPNIAANYNLALLYLEQKGLEDGELPVVSEIRAFDLLSAVVETGDADVQFQLAKLYKDGKGHLKNEAEAKRLFKLSAGQGHETAQEELQKM
jgi:uncharacterized protein